MFHRGLGAAVALVLFGVSLPASTGTPAGQALSFVPAVEAVTATVPLPTCTGVYEDKASPFASYADWSRTLLDTIYAVPSSYDPPDLVATGLPGGGLVRSLVKPDLTALAAAAAAAGAPIQIESAFRSYATQASTFEYWVSLHGMAEALLESARPGHSEHQLGTAIDFASYGAGAPWDVADWATSASGAWMAENAWQYGFILSYPKATSPAVTCYEYEPWHYRYVGRTEAAAIHASGLTIREYLWDLAAAPVGASFSLPAAGVTRSVTTTSNTIAWTESGPVASRSFREDYGPAVGGSCAAVAWKTAWTTSAPKNPYPISGYTRGDCYRYVLTLRNPIGSSATIVSGALLIASSATPVGASFTAPAAGMTVAGSTASNTIRWTESGPVASRSISEDYAPAISGSCANVSWKTAWTLTGRTSPFTIVRFGAGDCYRYRLTVMSSSGAKATATSGALLVGVPAAPTPTPDTTPPVAGIRPLPATSPASFTVAWSGADSGGSGLEGYDVQVASNGGAYVDWLTGTTATASTFTGTPGQTYAFRVRGRDNAGNVGAYNITNGWVATPTFAKGGFLQVTTTKLNVRAGAGTGATVLTQVNAPTMAAIVGGPVSATGYIWWQVRFPLLSWAPIGPTTTGWVAAGSGWLAPIHAPNTTNVR